MGLLAGLGGEHEGGDEGDVHMGKGGVGTLDGARPKPGDDGEFPPQERFEIGTFLGHFGSYLNLWIEVADALLSFLAHPGPIKPHILRQPRRPRPVGRKEK